MSEVHKKLIIDRDRSQIYSRLFFIDPRYIDFWLDNKDFRLEYDRLNKCGVNDSFYLFYLAAHNVFVELEDCASTGVDVGLDLGFAHKSIEEMERRLKNGYDDRASDPRLNFLVKRLTAPDYSIWYWLMVPEFVTQIQELIPKCDRIDNGVVYPIMRKIYDSKLNQKSEGVSENVGERFNFSVARKAIRSLEKRLKIPEEDRLKQNVHHH